MSNYSERDTQPPLYPPSSNDAFVLAADIQMRMVAEQENAYWHESFAQEPYYVAGRGYDQYQPAYELGWSAALQHPDADFADFSSELESQWNVRSSTSLLPWREVHLAAQAAWQHASDAMHDFQQSTPVILHSPRVASAVLPLHQKSEMLVNELARMRSSAMPMNDFAQQVLDRYIFMLKNLAQGLKPLFNVKELESGLGLGEEWALRMQAQWVRWRDKLFDWSAVQVFEACEQRGRGLLFAYQRVLRKKLPEAIKELLEQQVRMLQSGVEQLSWVRRNWPLA